MPFMERPVHAKESSDRAGPGGVCALVTKICTGHGLPNSTRLYAERQADCAVARPILRVTSRGGVRT